MFVSAAGRPWMVRVLPDGARCGRSGRLVAVGVVVEFFDAVHCDDAQPGDVDGFGPLGQFVSQYRLRDLLGDLLGEADEVGLDLNGGVDVWKIDAATMCTVRTWLRRVSDQMCWA